MKVIGAGQTHLGQTRDNNEDAFLADDQLRLYVVCDGMGGSAAGEVAAQEAAKTVANIVRSEERRITEFGTGDTPDSEIIGFMEDLVQEVCATVRALAKSRPEYHKMATTMTVLLVVGDRALMGHVGDSRLYIIREDQVYQLSDDHTFAQELVRTGFLEPEKVKKHKFSHVLTRSVGSDRAVLADTLLFDLLPGDVLVLCSDGLSVYLEVPGDLVELIGTSRPEAAAERLVQWANAKGGGDNITAIVVEASGDREADPEAEERHRQTQRKVEALRMMPLLAEARLADLLRIANTIRVVEAEEGETLVLKGQECTDYCLLLEGQVALSGDPAQAGLLEPGGTFGWTGLIEDCPALATVRATETARVLRIPYGDLTAILQRHPRLGMRVYRNLCRELAARLTT